MTLFTQTRHTANLIAFITAFLALTNTLAIDCARADTAKVKIETAEQAAPRNKLILCLGGGGTRGAAHIGVLRQLEKAHIKVDGVVGTSIGAIVGGLYCAGLSPDQIEAIFLGKEFIHAYLTVPMIFRLVVAPVMYIPHAFGHHPYDGLYRGNKFANFINKKVEDLACNSNNPSLNIEDLPIKFEAVSCDLLSAEPVAICKGNLGRALQASSAIPFLRRPVLMTRADFKRLPGTKADDEKDCYLFVDGGPQANLPVLQARALADHLNGAVVVAVDVYGDTEKWTPKHFRKIGSAAERSLEIILGSVEKKDLSKADLVIYPDVSGINLLSTKNVDAQKAIAEGDRAGQKALPELQKRLLMPSPRDLAKGGDIPTKP
jgi:NTE family protein